MRSRVPAILGGMMILVTSVVTAGSSQAFREPGPGCDIMVVVNFNDVALSQVLRAFSGATGLEFAATLDIDLDRKVHITLSDMPASIAIATALEQVGLDWERCGRTIIVKPASSETVEAGVGLREPSNCPLNLAVTPLACASAAPAG